MRNTSVDAMVLEYVQALKEMTQVPVRTKRSRAQGQKRKNKRKSAHKSRRRNR